MEFDIDLTNLLELYCANKTGNTVASGTSSRGTATGPNEIKKLAPSKYAKKVPKKIKKVLSDMSLSVKK